MERERLLNWLDSPRTRRKRKAIEELMHKSDNIRNVEMVFNGVKNLVNDENWSVRSKAINFLTELSLRQKEYKERVLPLCKEVIGSFDEHPNVLSTAIRSLSNLLKSSDSLEEETLDIAERGIAHENSEVKIASLQLAKLAIQTDEATESFKNELKELTANENKEVRKQALQLIIKTSDKLPQREEVNDLLLERLNDNAAEIRKTALIAIRKLYPLEELSPLNLMGIVEKRLRESHIGIKKETVKLIFEMIKENPVNSSELLGLLSEEVLSRTKNEELLFLTLNLLKGVLMDLPTEIINQNDIPKTLDLIAWNIPPNNPLRGKIKQLSQELLEKYLSYTVKERREKLRGSDRNI